MGTYPFNKKIILKGVTIMNEVELQGRILRKWEGRNVSIINLFIEAEGSTRDNMRVNFPAVLFNYVDKEKLNDFKEGDFVNITGTIKVRTIRDGDGQSRYQQYVKGIMISHVKNEMSEKFGTDLGGRFDYINESLIEGTITNANTRNGVINLLVRPTDEKFNVSLVSFVPNQDAFMRRFTTGSKVCIKSQIQTSRKEYEDDNVRFYENVVISYIDKKREPKEPVIMDDPTEGL